jgi:hypothetical protein
MGNYRYTLSRRWIGDGGLVNFVMLNPSTADDVFDDATVRKCCGFGKSWGYSALVVTNLFAFRATDPRELKNLSRALAVGPENGAAIMQAARDADLVVCAWGNFGGFMARDAEVCDLLGWRDLGCIGRTRAGNPVHPSRVAYTSAPESYRLTVLAAVS